MQRRAGDEARLSTCTGVDLRRSVLHEWFTVCDAPPLIPMLDVVLRGFASGALTRLVWIGRAVFPYPALLAGHRMVLRASVFVDPPDLPARLWAIDLVARGRSPTAVIADGQRFTLAHTRRLQLASGTGRGVCLLARPARDLQELSAATTRWRVEPCPGPGVGWTLTLVRNKDQPAFTDESRSWRVEWSDAQGLIHVPAVVGGRTRLAPARTA